MKRKRYIPLFEEIRLSDLKGSAGMSDFTRSFRSERNQLMKGTSEAQNAKLVDSKINISQDHVTFIFKTARTPKYGDENEIAPITTGSNFKIVDDGPQYTMSIRILDFLEWLDTTPEKITNKDLEDVIRVANVQVHCDCASQHWQGNNYNLSMFDGSLYPTNIAPTHWDKYHKDDNLVCKHLGGLINSIGFFIPQMRMSIKKKLGLTKRR
jgi:hypothetical protein